MDVMNDPRAGRVARFAFVLSVNIGLIAVGVIAAELYARHIYEKTLSQSSFDGLSMCIADSHLIWRYRPNVDITYQTAEYTIGIRTNAYGLRDEAVMPGTGGQTVLIIGDSFTFGWGVGDNERYSDVLRDELSMRLGSAVRVVNAGHWMYTFDQQLLMMKELIALYHPQVVVQALYWPHVRTLFGHDLSYGSDGLVATASSAIGVNKQGVLRFRSDWLDRPPLNSRLVAMTARYILNKNLVRTASTLLDFMRAEHTETDALWQLTDMLLAETLATVRKSGAVYVPVYVPVNVEMSDRFWQTSWEMIRPPDVDTGLPSRRLAAILDRLGVAMFDPRAKMHEVSPDSLYYKSDTHWTAKGHRLIGELLAPVVGAALSDLR